MKQSDVPHEKSPSASNEPDFDLNFEPDEPDFDLNFEPDEPQGDLIFEMEAPTTNRLVIPLELAESHFPPLATRKADEKKVEVETIKFTDSQNREWSMPIRYYEEERGFMILTGWPEFSTQHDIKAMDLIRIYEPHHKASRYHFLIRVAKQEQGTDPRPEFKDENFLFQIKLDKSDIDFNRVFLARDDVMRNFPEVEMERNSGKKKIMRFTDAKWKDWYMDIMRYNERMYMVIDGWDEFVKEKGVEAGDLIRFYKHVYACHSKHFLIRIAKRRGTGTGTGTGTGGPRPGHPGGGSGEGSSSQSYKGKEIARW